MQFQLPIEIKPLIHPIQYGQKILLTGSCFTEHIGNALSELKFDVLQNANGILFSPDAVCKSLISYAENKRYTAEELFYLNEVWHSWDHHSRFSHIYKEDCLQGINESQKKAHEFLKQSHWVVITLGSAFIYRLTKHAALYNEHSARDQGVANCHRAPANWFRKELMGIDEIQQMLEDCLEKLLKFNPGLNFIFTISPVRHIRDGVIENNRSKARLIESVHYIIQKFDSAFYFPAYELLIDVLRDYRYYDTDLVHPNYAATEYVMEKFTSHCISEEAQKLIKEIQQLVNARKHKPLHPGTQAHRQFLLSHQEKTKQLQEKYPFLDFSEEIACFSQE